MPVATTTTSQVNHHEPLAFTIRGEYYELSNDFFHPGGNEVLVQHSGQDITSVFEGGNGGHAHSKAAWAMLQKYRRRRVNGNSQAVTAPEQPAAQGIDESKPLLQQVWRLGPAYESWVHSPVPGQPRFFRSEWAERVTKVKWWVVPLLWLPLVAYTFHQALRTAVPLATLLALGVIGVVAWRFVEYCIHRFLFHMRPCTPWAIFLHFLFHGCHHKFPMDVERLVFPPLPASWVVYFFYTLLHFLLPKGAALAVFSGMLLGYVMYDCTHYFQHSGLMGGALKAAHMHHHYVDPHVNYGISSSLFDVLLGTMARAAKGGRSKSD